MIFNFKYIARCSIAAIGMMCCVTGCRDSLPEGLQILSESRIREEKTYSLPQMMLVVATERNRYEQVYTNEIWDVVIDDEGTVFRTHLLGEINGFLEELCTLTQLAEEQGITLSEQEKENIRQLSRVYYEGLTNEDKAYIQAGQEDIYNLYYDYHLANKTVEILTDGASLEVSDSDAKVITVAEIAVTDQAAAAEAYAKLQAEGADFTAVAREYMDNGPVTRQIARGVYETNYDEAAFALEEGQLSQVFQSGDQYYIIKCISAYDEKETNERKQQLALERKGEVFQQIIERYSAEHQVAFDDSQLKNLIFAPEDGTTTTNFFTLYQEYMNQ